MAEPPAGISPDAVPVRRLDSRTRRFADRIRVAGPQQALELDAVGGFIWLRIDGQRTVHDLAELLAAEYDVDMETVTGDIVELLALLASCEVLTLERAGPRGPVAAGGSDPSERA